MGWENTPRQFRIWTGNALALSNLGSLSFWSASARFQSGVLRFLPMRPHRNGDVNQIRSPWGLEESEF